MNLSVAEDLCVGRRERAERVHRLGGAVLLDETNDDVADRPEELRVRTRFLLDKIRCRERKTHMRMTAAITPPSIQDWIPNETAKQATRTRTCEHLWSVLEAPRPTRHEVSVAHHSICRAE